MYTQLAEFDKDYDYEVQGTLKVLRALTDQSLSQRVSEQGRTLGFLAWHIVTTFSEMMTHARVSVAVTNPNDPPPASAAEIAALYEKSAEVTKEAIRSAWTDAMLHEKIPMYGDQWPRGVVLSALLFHQCHHRGQMTVLMRQAGLKVPGLYGPAYEEWQAFGMAPQP